MFYDSTFLVINDNRFQFSEFITFFLTRPASLTSRVLYYVTMISTPSPSLLHPGVFLPNHSFHHSIALVFRFSVVSFKRYLDIFIVFNLTMCRVLFFFMKFIRCRHESLSFWGGHSASRRTPYFVAIKVFYVIYSSTAVKIFIVYVRTFAFYLFFMIKIRRAITIVSHIVRITPVASIPFSVER